MPRPLHDLSGRVVLITGIGSIGKGAAEPGASNKPSEDEPWGNGRAIATLFARRGAKIVGSDLKLDAAQESARVIWEDEEATAARAEVDGGKGASEDWIESLQADATNTDDCKRLVDACMKRHGRIDILVNNVGMSQPGGPAEMSEGVWDQQTNVNLKTVYLMCHHVLPIMEAQSTGGAVLNVSSVAAMRYIGKPQVAYAATKAAVIQFTKSTAVIYAQRTQGKVRLNTVVPGLMATPLVTVLADKYAGGDLDGFKKTRDAQVPVGRMGSAWDVAQAGLFLVSDEAKYITGQEIIVDGAITNSTGRT